MYDHLCETGEEIQIYPVEYNGIWFNLAQPDMYAWAISEQHYYPKLNDPEDMQSAYIYTNMAMSQARFNMLMSNGTITLGKKFPGLHIKSIKFRNPPKFEDGTELQRTEFSERHGYYMITQLVQGYEPDLDFRNVDEEIIMDGEFMTFEQGPYKIATPKLDMDTIIVSE